jgi:hypothetical protein
MIESAERAVTATAADVAGRSLVAWAGSIMAGVAVAMAGVAFLLGPNWNLMWAATVLLMLAWPTSSVLRRLGYGHS